jgi:hypothetical protein
LPFPPVFLLLFCSAICFAVAVPDSRVDNLETPVLAHAMQATFTAAMIPPEQRSSYLNSIL